MIKEIEVGGVKHCITLADDMVGKGLKKAENGAISVDVDNLDINEEKLVKTTWAELKALRDEAKLNAGTFYRITDYVTTTTQSQTKSANHPFDVIVLALSENTLSEDAKAALHEGDTYFADSDLSAWELKYCLDNDRTRFSWADETNGKGVIYRMIDEKRNDCPYDFKNILFRKINLPGAITSDRYYHTFSYMIGLTQYDGTTDKRIKKCHGNVMGECRNSEEVLQLNKNVFKNISVGGIITECHSNTFGVNCYSNALGYGCYSNTFGDGCHDNIFGDNCTNNTFGNHLQNHSLDTNKTSLTHNEEFYDDGSGQLVPTKHPDLSTQPSILPYKFMGQYVYEQILPYKKETYTFEEIGTDKPVIIQADAFGVNGYAPSMAEVISNGILFYPRQLPSGELNILYYKIVYTSIPEEGGDYYGYSHY